MNMLAAGLGPWMQA